MVYRATDLLERLLRRTCPRRCLGSVRGGASPRIGLSVDDGQSVVADVVATVLIDDADVWLARDVEGVTADDLLEIEVDGAGDEGECALRDTGAGLEEAPLRAVLVWPAAPGLSDVVLSVEGLIMG